MDETHIAPEADELVGLRARNHGLELALLELRRNTDDRLIRAALKIEAQRAGMLDLDGLKLADTASVSVDATGEVQGAADLVARLRRDKAFLFASPSSSSAMTPPASSPPTTKLATEMTLQEWRTARADLLRRR